ncbi:MAG: hypothetical protein KAS07_00425 [Candidatus Pacebacteria bacterium]|nr:hypothetical protein [Candidatus Paceibacterota bacterium]
MEDPTTTLTILDIGITLLIAVVVAVATGFVAYCFGFKQYLRQRKWERIRKTYIEEGIGKVIEGTDQLSTACYLNYGKARLAFDILESSVDDPEKTKDTIERIFTEMENVKLAPNYGNLKLVIFNSESLLLLVIKMWTEFQQLNETIRHVGLQGVKNYFNEQHVLSKDERRNYISEQKKIIREEWNRAIRMYEPLKGSLFRLQIETDKIDVLCIKDIDKIATQQGVIKIIEEIEATYKNTMEKLKKDIENDKQ